MIDASFVDRVADRTERPIVCKVHGVDRLLLPRGAGCFVDSELPMPEAEPAALRLSTLTGLIGYIQANRDQLPLAECILRVVDHAPVSLESRLLGWFNQRLTYATASIESCFGQGFSFGSYCDHETFIVGLQALFVDDTATSRADILRVLSGVRDGEVRTFEDDGTTQAVTAKAGVHLVQNLAVPNPVTLRPYRTFREIEQPASLFVLRLKSGGGQAMPAAALFEADGGIWKLEARGRVAEYLVARLGTTVSVLA